MGGPEETLRAERERRAHVLRLFLILQTRRGIGVTDARDYVYAHLGFIDRSLYHDILIDYNQSVGTVFENLAHLIIDTHSYQSLFQSVIATRPGDRHGEIPSWVPDVSLCATSIHAC